MIHEVLSQVFPDVQVFRDVCYEWEKVCSEYFNVPIRQIIIPSAEKQGKIKTIKASAKRTLANTFPFLRSLYKKLKIFSQIPQDIHKPLSLCFLMFVHESRICENINCLPVFLDVWKQNNGIDYLAEHSKHLKIFYVTSRDVYNAVLDRNPSSCVKYIPLSVSDKYYSFNFEKYREKTIDVVQFGRANYVLHEYMLRYTSEHNSIDYIYSGTGRSTGSYISTKRGIIGTILDRQEFMRMLACAKVSLVSSPGYENSKDYAQDIHFVTPRFYESAVLGCALLGRYPDNEEFTELNMRRYCPNITSYEQFCHELERALAQSPEELYAQNRDFIINSLTSKRAEQIQRDLASMS